MKYVLPESAKYILSERFILTEALTANDINSVRVSLINIRNGIKNTTQDKNNKDTINQIQEQIFVLKNITDNTNDITMLKGQAKQIVQKIEQILSLADPTFNKSKISAAFNGLKTLINGSDTSRKTRNKIKEQIQILVDAVENFNISTNKTVKTNDEIVTLIEQTIAALGQLNDFIKTAQADTQVEKFILDCKNNTIPKYLADKNNLALIQISCKNIINAINDQFEKANYVADSKHSSKIDWEKRYSNAIDKKLFWEQYYKEVWGKNAQRILALGEVFRKECLSLGFTAKTNPFIAFLQKYLVEENYQISAAVYIALHNAIVLNNAKAHSPIALTNLTSTTNVVNLAICKDLYSKSGNDAEEYFKLLVNINDIDLNKVLFDRAKTSSQIADPTEKRNFDNITSHFDPTQTDHIQFIWAILYNNITLSNILNKATNYISIPTTIDEVKIATLRPLTEINRILDVIAPTQAEKTFNKSTLNTLISKILADSGNEAKWVRVLVTLFLLPNEANTIYTSYAKVNTATLNGVEENTIKQAVFNLGTSMTFADVKNIIKALESKGIKLT